MAFKVVLDANVLYPASLRDTLLRLAERKLYELVWTERILDEASRNLVVNQRADPAQAARLKAAMRRAFPEALVDRDAVDAIEPIMTNHPGDRHVLAAAVVAGAEGIVTFNARHFSNEALAPFRTQRIDPDDFLCALLDIDRGTVADALIEQASHLRRPPLTPRQLLAYLERSRVGEFAERMRAHLDASTARRSHTPLPVQHKRPKRRQIG